MIPNNILVPIDFSAHAEHALDYACALATGVGATVHLIHVIGLVLPDLDLAMTDAMIQKLVDGNRAALEKLADEHRKLATIGTVKVASGDPRDVILEAALAVGADLIAMGTHGRRGIARMLLGSVTESIIRRATCPVLAVPLA